MSHYFERPKFKSIIHYYLNQFCDMEGQLQNLGMGSSNMMQSFPAALKKSLRLFIIEIIPTILVSDGHNFIEAIFTKESINDFRKNYSHVKFSNLRDKVIHVSKWQLQLDHADSMKQFNSYQNINIKLVIEQFKPLMHESLNARITHSATSIFRNPEIQTLVKNYRHWFAQTLIQKQAVNQTQTLALPSLNDVFGPSKVKKNSQNEYSQNTTQFSENDNNISDDIGASIQKSQVFRLSPSEFKSDIKLDSQNDFEDFQKLVLKKKSHTSGDLRLADIDRIVIQEKGEQFFAEKNFSKSRQWLEQVQDEHRREELKLQIEYFQVGNQASKFDSTFETVWQREEREKHQKKFQNTGYRSKRIIGYTFGYTASSIKEKLVRMLESSKSLDIQGYAKKNVSKAKSVSPLKGRPRSNSQENLLLLNNAEDSKSQLYQLQPEAPISREPLSQFVQHQMPVFHDDDTQSEQDSMEDEINQQLQNERDNQPQEDKVFDEMQPVGISMYKSYLQWFKQNDISHQSYIDKQLARDFEEEERQQEIVRAQKEKESKRFSFRLVEKNKPKQDAEMQIEQQSPTQKLQNQDQAYTQQQPQNQIVEQSPSPVKQESDQLQLERSDEQEAEMKQESGKLSPIQQFTHPMEDILMAKEEPNTKVEMVQPKQEPLRQEMPFRHEEELPMRKESLENSPERFLLKQDSAQSESPQRQQQQRGSPSRSSYSKCSSAKNSSPVRQDLLAPSSPVKELSSKKQSPVMKEAMEILESPSKPIIDLNLGIKPPKPVKEMTGAERELWQLELQFKEMQQRMLQQQQEMANLFEKKRQQALLLKEEEDRQERERLEKERLEKERLEKERLEKIRLEKERKERERLEQESMRKREQEELTLMRWEEKLMRTLIAEERRIEQERILELQRQIELEKERQRQEAIKQQQLRQQRMKEDRERQEKLAQQERERQEKERKLKLAKAQASQARMTNEAVEAEKRRRMAMLQEERSRQQPSDDWQEGQQSDSYDSEYVKELDKEREEYVSKMNKKYGKTLNQEIRRMETKDMTRRKIKKVENEDKLYDFVKIKNIKQEKMEQQRRQLENSSSSQPSKDSKDSKKKQDDDESSEKLSSSKSEVDDLNQYDLFDSKTEDQLPDIDDESITEITQSQLDSPSKVKKIEAYPNVGSVQIETLTAQIAQLKEQLAGAVQSIQMLSSQSQIKDQRAPQLEEDEDDYHVPTFGSQQQASPKKKSSQIQPFNLGKRNYSQHEEEQQYRHYEREYNNSPTKQTQFKNLADFVNFQKMQTHKEAIQAQHVQKEKYMRRKHEQQRMGQGPSQQQRGSQGMHGRPRERSNSREQMRPPQPVMRQQQRPQGQPPMQQRPTQQQYRNSQSQQQGPPRSSQQQGAPIVRQRSGSPVKQQPPVGMNVAGNKRYVHSQNPGAPQGQYMKPKMQTASQSFDPQTKRRKIVIEDQDL